MCPDGAEGPARLHYHGKAGGKMPTNHADVLRAVGQVLEGEGPGEVEILRQGDGLFGWWRAPDRSRRHRGYTGPELERLREEGRRWRGSPGRDPSEGLAEQLRTIGQELDHAGADVVAIAQDPEGFFIVGLAGNRAVSRYYLIGEILSLSRQRRELRAA